MLRHSAANAVSMGGKRSLVARSGFFFIDIFEHPFYNEISTMRLASVCAAFR